MELVEYKPSKLLINSSFINSINEAYDKNNFNQESIIIPIPKDLDPDIYKACLYLIQFGKFPKEFKINNLNIIPKWIKVTNYLGIDIKCPIDNWIIMLQNNDKDNKLFNHAVYDVIHRNYIHKYATNFDYLIRLDETFNPNDHKVQLNYEECSILKKDKVTKRNFDYSNGLNTLNEYFSKFNNFPWYGSYNEKEGAVIAGGVVVAATHGYNMDDYLNEELVNIKKFEYLKQEYEKKRVGDIDIMIVANDENSMMNIFEDIIISISQCFSKITINRDDESVLSNISKPISISNHGTLENYLNKDYSRVFTIYAYNDNNSVKFQIIKIIYPSPYHIIMGFDIDISGMLYFPDNIYITPNAARAAVNGFNLYDANKLSKSVESRLIKYANKYGLDILVGGISQYALDNNIKNINYKKKYFSRKHDLVSLIKIIHYNFDDHQSYFHQRYYHYNNDYDVGLTFWNRILSGFSIFNWKKNNPKKLFYTIHEGALSGSFFPIKSDIYQRFFDL